MFEKSLEKINLVKLFCDGSVNPKEKIGYGAYFILENKIDKKIDIKLKRFENTSSTKLELETLIWAVSDICTKNKRIEVYTDCQNILGLKKRRDKLEKNSFKSSTGKLIRNYQLYKDFYLLTDNINCNFIKVQGHKKSSLREEVNNLFNLVDKASRNALRNEFKEL